MLRRHLTLFAAIAVPVVGAAASLGQSLPPGLPPGVPPGAPPSPFMMPPLLVGGAVPSLEEMCIELSALRAGYFADLRQRLELTPAQEPLWRDVVAAVDEASKVARADCATLPAEPGKPALSQALSIADRHLEARRQGLQRISGPLLKLYEGLSTEQREIMDRAVPPPMIL